MRLRITFDVELKAERPLYETLNMLRSAISDKYSYATANVASAAVIAAILDTPFPAQVDRSPEGQDNADWPDRNDESAVRDSECAQTTVCGNLSGDGRC